MTEFTFSADLRRQVSESLQRTGVEPDRARLCVDIACRAAEEGLNAFLSAAGRSPHGSTQLNVIELGSQLLAGKATHLFEISQRLGVADETRSARVEVRL